MINVELEDLYYEDITERKSANTDKEMEALNLKTSERLSKLRKILPRIDTTEIWNCHYIAYLLQHGDSPDEYKMAHEYAKKAVDMGSKATKWLFAATLDRYLVSIGKLQKYGTQYKLIDGEKKYFPTDGTITEEEKRGCGVIGK